MGTLPIYLLNVGLAKPYMAGSGTGYTLMKLAIKTAIHNVEKAAAFLGSLGAIYYILFKYGWKEGFPICIIPFAIIASAQYISEKTINSPDIQAICGGITGAFGIPAFIGAALLFAYLLMTVFLFLIAFGVSGGHF